MANRRNFLAQASGAVAFLGLGMRNLIAQFRPPYVMESAPGTETTFNGKKYLYFGGTGYYTLQNHPVLLKAASEALEKYGMHSATSRSFYGTTALSLAVEKRAAEYYGTEDAAYLPSGYLTNVAGLQALAAKVDVVFIDDDSHYSLTDFACVIGKPVFTFTHRDAEDLGKKLRAQMKPRQKPLILSDGVFPLFGQIAPVPKYLEVAKEYDPYIWLDDAHSVGVLGENGRGTYDYFGLKSERLLFGGTFSKAFGAHGGVIPGKPEFVQSIREGHVMNGATSSPSPAAASALMGMDLLTNHPEMRTQLWKNAKKVKAGLGRLGIPVDDTVFPAAAWTLKSSDEMNRVHKAMMDRGIAIQRLHYAGGGAEGVLRVVVFSTHTEEQIHRLTEELGRVL